jgi:hypothetical protein
LGEHQGEVGAQPKVFGRQATVHSMQDTIDPGMKLSDIEWLGHVVLGI